MIASASVVGVSFQQQRRQQQCFQGLLGSQHSLSVRSPLTLSPYQISSSVLIYRPSACLFSFHQLGLPSSIPPSPPQEERMTVPWDSEPSGKQLLLLGIALTHSPQPSGVLRPHLSASGCWCPPLLANLAWPCSKQSCICSIVSLCLPVSKLSNCFLQLLPDTSTVCDKRMFIVAS